MGARQGLPDYPVPVLAAAILAAEGVSFLLIGSAALWLHGEPIPVADADGPGRWCWRPSAGTWPRSRSG